MPRITTCLWFDDDAVKAAKFYVSVFKPGKLGQITLYPADTPGPAGKVMTITFKILGQEFTALNGGPLFKFNESVSFVVHCDNQKELDRYWKKLSAGGKVQQCGWLKDKFGVSWQIVPKALFKLMSSKNPDQTYRVMQAVLKMVKLDIRQLERAAKGR